MTEERKDAIVKAVNRKVITEDYYCTARHIDVIKLWGVIEAAEGVLELHIKCGREPWESVFDAAMKRLECARALRESLLQIPGYNEEWE